MPAVVSDSSPLIYFTRLGHFPWLELIFGQVLIPQAVWREIVQDGSRYPESGEVQNAIQAGWMKVEHAELTGDVELAELDPGEAEAITLAQKLDALLIIDETAGRAVALHRNVKVTGTLGILLEAKRRGLTPNLAQEIERLLHSTTFRLAAEVRDELLRQVGESPP